MLAEGLAEAFQLQAESCRQLGSPLYGDLLDRCLDDLRRGGIVAQVMNGWTGRPVPDAVVLRLMGALHRLALRGEAPGLARFYPSVGGSPELPAAWEAFRDEVERNAGYLRQALSQQVQTNEVSRCAALLGGFLYMVQLSPQPLRLLEIGSSAGLNQNWDRYRYEDGGAHLWGDPASPVTIPCKWHGRPRGLASKVEVIGRAGCDVAPLDVRDEDTALRLQSFVWPDQPARLQLLRAAIELARRDLPAITRASAPAWLEEQLRTPQRGVTTVVFHSMMWWYMSHDERDQVARTLEEAGGRAGADARLGWLRLEPREEPRATLSLRHWPGGEEIVLAHASPHGSEVWWEESAI
jgi:hypothetical protein